jgi:hypothetical protein
MHRNGIRTVTAEEVEHYIDRGWVKLDQLLSPELTAKLLDRAKHFVGPYGVDHSARPDLDLDIPFWQDYHDVVQEDDLFADTGLSAGMGTNAQLMMRRTAGVLLWSNLLAVKIGVKQNSPIVSDATLFHQDGPDLPIDRSSWVRFWIALDHVTPDMGPVHFVDRSHLGGLIGTTHFTDGDPDAALFEDFPELARRGLSEAVEFRPGDATVHSMFTVHGGQANETNKPRWTLILTYLADDVRYTGSQLCADENMRKVRKSGLAPGDTFRGPLYPRVCDAVGAAT